MKSSTKRGLGVGVSAFLLGTACWSVVVACGTDEARPSFSIEDASEAEAPPPSVDGSFEPADAGCAPAAPARPIATAPSTHFTSGSCTPTQVDGYLKDCLKSDGNVCNAYKTANPTCATCVESNSGDPAWGPIVFYGAHQYYDYNFGGCIANVTGDYAATGCGAAETRYLECRRAACATCLPAGLPRNYAPFYACENTVATDKLCTEELTGVNTACADYFAAKNKDACQSTGLSSDDYLRQLMTAFCVGTGDAGTDGGDGGDGGP
ncbi:MAG: hypothetical protein WDN08_04495 [Rhizomicrobium sp.]